MNKQYLFASLIFTMVLTTGFITPSFAEEIRGMAAYEEAEASFNEVQNEYNQAVAAGVSGRNLRGIQTRLKSAEEQMMTAEMAIGTTPSTAPDTASAIKTLDDSSGTSDAIAGAVDSAGTVESAGATPDQAPIPLTAKEKQAEAYAKYQERREAALKSSEERRAAIAAERSQSSNSNKDGIKGYVRQDKRFQ